jgi:hypothetical protein
VTNKPGRPERQPDERRSSRRAEMELVVKQTELGSGSGPLGVR